VFYRVEIPMMVLVYRDGHQAAVTIQSGEIVAVLGPAQDERFTVVEAGGEQFLVFERDLKFRGTPISGKQVLAS
jgi:hypothetical protein